VLTIPFSRRHCRHDDVGRHYALENRQRSGIDRSQVTPTRSRCGSFGFDRRPKNDVWFSKRTPQHFHSCFRYTRQVSTRMRVSIVCPPCPSHQASQYRFQDNYLFDNRVDWKSDEEIENSTRSWSGLVFNRIYDLYTSPTPYGHDFFEIRRLWKPPKHRKVKTAFGKFTLPKYENHIFIA